MAFLLRRRVTRALLVALFTITGAISLTGCGSGGSLTPATSSNIRYTPPGTYQYQITASSTTGVQLSQTVTLNLIVTAR